MKTDQRDTTEPELTQVANLIQERLNLPRKQRYIDRQLSGEELVTFNALILQAFQLLNHI